MKIIYKNETTIDITDLKQTLLDMSLNNNIPHCHACGGNARCSTCRVIILDGHENVLPRNDLETILAQEKGLEENIRLACQTRVTGPVTVRRLVIDEEDIEVALAESNATTGKEMDLAILFSDIRNFTPFVEEFMPYDVIHILNRYFRKVGEQILRYNGHIDKYMGDGIMALFGLEDSSPEMACENSVLSALSMLKTLENLNQYLKKQFTKEFHIGIGIHFGSVIVGEMGHPLQMQFSAIGDTVNMASRVESSTKNSGAAILISDSVYEHTKSKFHYGKKIATELKGKTGEYNLYEVLDVDQQWYKTHRQEDLVAELKENLLRTIMRSQAPQFLRLAFHDAFVYDSCDDNTGRVNGAIRFPEILERPENKGLEKAIAILEPVKKSYPDISWADLIAFAGAAAVQKCGGPNICLRPGRSDVLKPPQESHIPHEDMDLLNLKKNFTKVGFSIREFVAICGAHTLGKAHGKPFTRDLFSFTNSYFQVLLMKARPSNIKLLASDEILLTDLECYATVEEFAKNQQSFFQEFAKAYIKMTSLPVK